MAEIYVLTEPGPDGAVRYVGKANNSVARFKGHIRDSRRRNTPVYCWIRSLLAKGQVPGMLVLVAVADDDWERVEISMIQQARAAGCDLLNLADGGDQPKCPKSVRADNARMVAKLRVSTPEKKRIYELKRQLGMALKQGIGGEALRAKCRAIAKADPQTFPQWLNL